MLFLLNNIIPTLQYTNDNSPDFTWALKVECFGKPVRSTSEDNREINDVVWDVNDGDVDAGIDGNENP